MPMFAIPALLGASALGGALANRSKKQTTTSNYSNTSTTTPQLSPEQESIYSLLAKNVMGRLQGQTPLAGYEASGLSNISGASDAIRRSIESSLASRGLLNSPMGATALANADISRGAQSAEFRNSLPLLQNSLDLQNVGAAGTVFGLRPMASTTTSSGTGTGVTNIPGNVAGGAFGGFAEALGRMIGRGAFGSGGVTGTPKTPSLPAGNVSWGIPSPRPMIGLPPGIDLANILRQIGGFG